MQSCLGQQPLQRLDIVPQRHQLATGGHAGCHVRNLSTVLGHAELALDLRDHGGLLLHFRSQTD
jgi:hypothetical protein